MNCRTRLLEVYIFLEKFWRFLNGCISFNIGRYVNTRPVENHIVHEHVHRTNFSKVRNGRIMSQFHDILTDVAFYIDLSPVCYFFLSLLRLLILESTVMKSVRESSDGKKREPGRESPFSTFPSHHSPLAYCIVSHHPSLELLSRLQRNSVAPAQLSEKPGAHNPERATPILGLRHGVFTDQFSFRYILGYFLPRKQNLHHVYERIRSVRYQEGKTKRY